MLESLVHIFTTTVRVQDFESVTGVILRPGKEVFKNVLELVLRFETINDAMSRVVI